MTVRFTSGLLVAAALWSAAAPVRAQQKDSLPAPEPTLAKEQLHEHMRLIANEIAQLRDNHGSSARIAGLIAQYEAISSWLGGDQPTRLAGARGAAAAQPTPQSSVALLAPAACAGPTTTTNFAGTGGPILAPLGFTGTSFTLSVSGVSTFLWDLNLNTDITHPNCADLDITLRSPAGTVVTITTDNGGTNDNVFGGTLWDDNVNDGAVDHVYTNLVAATPLTPEGRLEAFRGEDPNGTWTLTILDDATGSIGTLNSWSLDLATTGGAPATTSSTVSNTPALAIPDNTPAGVTDTIVIGGLGTFTTKVTVYMEVPHTFPGDLDITLQSPAGTIVPVTTDNAGSNDNAFNGTLFDGDVLDTVTDHVYAVNVIVPLLSPEGAFDNFLGQDPNGTWTLKLVDDAGVDVGTLVRWDLSVTAAAAPVPVVGSSFPGTGGPIADFSGGVTLQPTVFTLNVSGVGASTWDIDLNTAILHTSNADLDITLTSPLGTVVTISTDNGGTNDNGFNGTLWDDNANDGAVDHVYTNLVTATPLSPEGRLAGFRGEDPNGLWTLTITDDAALDNGSVTSWSLDVTTSASAPGEVSTTLTNSPALAIPDNTPAGVTDTLVASGLGTYLIEAEVYLEIPHTFPGDLDITLQSPLGTIVQVTTDNGVSNDNAFNGTLFDSDVTDTVTDHVYAVGVVVPLLSPEGSLDVFRGEDPNGTWTLKVVDDAGIDTGTLVRWDLTLRTCIASPAISFCGNGDPLRVACPCGNNGTDPAAGCSNSLNAAGALITANGSVVADNVVLDSTGMTGTICIFFRTLGPAQINGVQFGDGITCTGGALLRLRAVAFPGGIASVAQFPVPPETITLSARSGTFPGSGASMQYSSFYRNAAAAFCPPFTFNTANTIEITW